MSRKRQQQHSEEIKSRILDISQEHRENLMNRQIDILLKGLRP